MPTPEAMLLVMQGGDQEGLDLSPYDADYERYGRLFDARDTLVAAYRAGEPHDVCLDGLFRILDEEFCDMPDEDDRERAREIISGLFQNPREIEDLMPNQIAVIEDTAVNVGMIRSLLYSYGLDLTSDAFFKWVARYRHYMVV